MQNLNCTYYGATGYEPTLGGQATDNRPSAWARTWGNIVNFFEQANRSFGIFDSWVPPRESFESGARQLLGGPCDYNCGGYDANVKLTADAFQSAAQAVAEAGNRYYPELAKTAVLAALPLGGAAKGTEDVVIQFGKVENQVSHTFRHIEAAGFDRQVVESAIKQDLSKAAESLSKGQYNGSVVVNGTKLDYSAFKFPDGTINVGRITPPRP